MSEAARRIGLPAKPFLYTVDQVAYLLSVEEDYVKRVLLFYEGRSVGVCPKDRIPARNIAPAGEKPEWRVAERALVAFMRFKGYKYHERGYIS